MHQIPKLERIGETLTLAGRRTIDAHPGEPAQALAARLHSR
jgi:hypothetical protein